VQLWIHKDIGALAFRGDVGATDRTPPPDPVAGAARTALLGHPE